MSHEKLEVSVPKCDRCGKRGSFGQMMPWPHSGWMVLRLSDPQRTLDFCSESCLRGYVHEYHLSFAAPEREAVSPPSETAA